MSFLNRLRRVASDRRGISTVEYGILIAVVGVGLYTALDGIDDDIAGVITDNIEQLTDQAPATTPPG